MLESPDRAARSEQAVVVTTFSPNGIEGQMNAMRSWTDSGLSVHVVNWDGEISESPRGDSTVSFQSIPGEPNADANHLMPLDAVAEYLRSLAFGTTYLGITNSDIHLSNPGRLRDALEHSALDLIIGSRLDVSELNAADGTVYDDGYDLFFLSPRGLAALPQSEFVMGRPWWDFWVPVSLLLNGYSVGRFNAPVIRHVRHDVRFSPESFLRLGRAFHTRVSRLVEQPQTAVSSERSAFLREVMTDFGVPTSPTAASALSPAVVGALAESMLRFIREASEDI